MIAWNAFVTYLLKPTVNIKIAVASILIGLLFLKRTSFLKKAADGLKKISTTKTLLTILLLAFGLRLFWMLWSPHIPPASITEDAQIWRYAMELSEGKGFRDPFGNYTAYRPIGYPAFLSLLIQIFGPRLFVAEFFQVIFGTLNVFLIFLLGKKLKSELFGLLAALLYTAYPSAIMSTKLLLDEHLFILLWLTGILLLISDYQKPSCLKVTWAGLVVGFSALFRTYSLITVGSVFLVWLLVKRDLKSSLIRCLGIGFLTFLCALPWAVRNYYRLGVALPYTSIVGIHLYYANNPTSDVRYPVNPDFEHGGDPGFLYAKNEVEKDFAGRKAALQWIRQNPSMFFQKALGRLFYMLGVNNEGWVIEDNFATIRPGARPLSGRLLKFLGKWELYYHVTIFWLAVVGFFLGGVHWVRGKAAKGWPFVIVTLALYLSVTAVALNHRKYRFVIEPLFCLLAVYALSQTAYGRNTD